MHNLSLKIRILVPLIVASLMVFFLGIYFINHMENEHKREVVLQEAQALQGHFQSSLSIKAELMESGLRFIAQSRPLTTALGSGDRGRLLELATPIFERLYKEHNITHFYFHDSKRINLLRVHKPDRYGDLINRFTALGAEARSNPSSGIELGPLGTFTLRSVLPITLNGELLGYIELGQEIDDLIQELGTTFQTNLLMFIDKQFLVQSDWESGMQMLNRPFDWNMLSKSVLISQNVSDLPLELLNRLSTDPPPESIKVLPDIKLGENRYWAALIPLEDAGKREVASLVMLHDMTQMIAASKRYLLQFLIIFLAIGVAVFTLFYAILDTTEKKLADAGQKLIAAGKAREDMQIQLLSELREEHAKLEESQDKFQKISASAQDAIICMDSDGSISFWNAAAERIFGYSQEQAIGKNLHRLIVPVRHLEAHLQAFPKFQQTGEGCAIGKTLEMAAVRQDGAEIPVELSLAASHIAGEWSGIGVLRDISERKEAQKKIEEALNVQRVLDTILNISLPPLKLEEVLLRSLDALLSIPVYSLLNKGAVFLTSEDGKTLKLAAQRNLPSALLQTCHEVSFGKCLCGSSAATHEITFSSILNEKHDNTYDGIEAHGHYCVPIISEKRMIGVLNTYVPAEHVEKESEKKFLKTVADTLAVVIERKHNEERLHHLAHHDKLTGLPNRVLLYDRMEQATAMAMRNRQQFAVAFLDLDDFKKINDTLGHDMGDVLLVEAGKRLLACVRATDTVARMGGDEFTVIITGINTAEDARHVADNILNALLDPFALEGKHYTIGCSVGVALFPVHGNDRESLLKAADAAMYHAKEHGNSVFLYREDHPVS